MLVDAQQRRACCLSPASLVCRLCSQLEPLCSLLLCPECSRCGVATCRCCCVRCETCAAQHSFSATPPNCKGECLSRPGSHSPSASPAAESTESTAMLAPAAPASRSQPAAAPAGCAHGRAVPPNGCARLPGAGPAFEDAALPASAHAGQPAGLAPTCSHSSRRSQHTLHCLPSRSASYPAPAGSNDEEPVLCR